MRSCQYQQVHWPTKAKLFEARIIGYYKIPKHRRKWQCFVKKEEVAISECRMDEIEGWALIYEYSKDWEKKEKKKNKQHQHNTIQQHLKTLCFILSRNTYVHASLNNRSRLYMYLDMFHGCVGSIKNIINLWYYFNK